MARKFKITDKNGDQHEVEAHWDMSDGSFKLVCTNSGDVLVQGETEHEHGREIAYVSSCDPIFQRPSEGSPACDETMDLTNEIEEALNEVAS